MSAALAERPVVATGAAGTGTGVNGRARVVDVLPGPFGASPDPAGLRPLPPTRAFAAGQVRALLSACPAFHQLEPTRRQALRRDLERVASYAAELVRDDFYQSRQLGQRPVLCERVTDRAPAAPAARAQAAGDELRTTGVDSVARVTRQTLRAIAFPDFVADLIRSTFRSIVDASIQQLEMVSALFANVTKTVDDFENDNITDNQARDWLAQQYPQHVRIEAGGGEARLAAVGDAGERPPPRWRDDLGLPRDVGVDDEDAFEEVLVPAARRKLSQQRLQLLSTLVMMGMQRIVVTGGRLRAGMAFHIDASDAAREARATDFDMRVSASGSVGFGPWSAAVSTSVGYVSSTRNESESEINVSADLTGEVELHFRSDDIPIERFVPSEGIARISGNTAVPEQNIPWGTPIETRAAPAARRQSSRLGPAPAPPPLMTPPPVGGARPQQPGAQPPAGQQPAGQQPPARPQQPAAGQQPPGQQQPRPPAGGTQPANPNPPPPAGGTVPNPPAGQGGGS